jgi:hypothetical protein
MPPVIIGPRCNRRVTCSPDPHNDRSESALVVNPNNPYNLVGASKKFTDPQTYAFSLAAYSSFDSGQSWNESPPFKLLNTGDLDDGGELWTGDSWVGISDPTVAWDDIGNVYLIGLAFGVPSQADPYHLLGLGAYKSTDGGRTWSGPRIVHAGFDDKQWAAGDTNPASPYHGNVYVVWDLETGGLGFSRTKDHGATWIGPGAQPSGTSITSEIGFGEINVATDDNGAIYVFGLGSDNNKAAIKFVKSTDGGETFSPAKVLASGITPVPGQLPGGKFRLETMPTGCCGSMKHIVCAWPDYRDGVARIYYNRSNNGGNSWQGSASGDPLLIGAVASAANQHDFMPQIVSTPNGEIGCVFYEFGPKGGGQTPLIDVVLAVSTDNGHTFPNRVTVTEQPWDPTVDEVYAHGVSTVTFIGDYFGLDASRLGFFPFWTDTRTGVQEIFTARVAVNPADVCIRDSSSDTGTVPSPGFHWEAPDLVVRWHQDGNTTFADQGIQKPILNDHYVYGRVTNNGPNTARNVTLAVAVGNWPQLAGLPGTEFRYPQDWYQGDWATAGLQANRLFLGESAPIDIPNGQTKIIGPVVWFKNQIPDPNVPNPWHPCLLAEVRTDNNDSAGGPNGCDIDADPDPCSYGSYFWGNNNACQRNLSYVPVMAATAAYIELPFLVGSVWSNERFLEVIIDKGRELAETPMKVRMETIRLLGEKPRADRSPGELVLVDGGRVVVRVGTCEAGEIIAAPGTIWRASYPSLVTPQTETCYCAHKVGNEWKLLRRKSGLGFPIAEGELRRMTLSFTTPRTLKPGSRALVRVFQRNAKRVITGSVLLKLEVPKTTKPMRDGQARVAQPTKRVARKSVKAVARKGRR